MNRLCNLVKGEFKLLYKNGIVLVYCFFSVFYIFLLYVLPLKAVQITTVICVLTDPAAMGLFFMGAMILLEKSQQIGSSLAVSPIKIGEYIFAKLFVLLTAGVVVSIILFIVNYIRIPEVSMQPFFLRNLGIKIIGVALSSMLFSMCGMFVAYKSDGLNTFLICTVPFEIVLFVPAILFLFNVFSSNLWVIHPGVAAICLLNFPNTTIPAASCISSLSGWILMLSPILRNIVKKELYK